MATVELIGLVELLRQLVQRSSEMNREYFDNFVQPVWNAFSAIHNDYKVSINKYIELLARPDFPIEELVNIIRHDSIVTKDIRAELEIMIRKTPIGFLEINGGMDLLAEFITYIVYYFMVDDEIRSSMEIEKNKKITKEQKLSVGRPFMGWITTVAIGNSRKSRDYGDIMSANCPNGPRFSAIIYLSRGGKNINRKSAQVFFENLFADSQGLYIDALNKYHDLRVHLLS